MRYETIFFDLDHTLWDFNSNAKEALDELISKYRLLEKGVTSHTCFANNFFEVNERLWTEFRNGIISKEALRKDRFQYVLKKYEIDDTSLASKLGEDYVAITPYKTHLHKHSIEVLQYLQNKYSLYIITNGFEEVQHVKLRTCNLHHYFFDVFTSERSGYTKPDSRMFYYALQVAKAKPETSLMIGDSLDVDIAGAQNVGMHQVFFNPDKKGHTAQPTHEVNCLSELMKLL